MQYQRQYQCQFNQESISQIKGIECTPYLELCINSKQVQTQEKLDWYPSTWDSRYQKLREYMLHKCSIVTQYYQAIQCLSNTTPLTDYWISQLHIQELNPSNPLSSQGQITKVFAGLVQDLWQYNQPIEPFEFLQVLSTWKPCFSHYSQEDSHELLAYLLDILHEDLNRVKNPIYIEEKTFQQVSKIEAEEAWQQYLRRNKSIIVDLFQGQQKSMLMCMDCKYQSHKFESFMYLSLPVSESGSSTLQECINAYTDYELLQGQECWRCPQCKDYRKSKKRRQIYGNYPIYSLYILNDSDLHKIRDLR